MRAGRRIIWGRSLAGSAGTPEVAGMCPKGHYWSRDLFSICRFVDLPQWVTARHCLFAPCPPRLPAHRPGSIQMARVPILRWFFARQVL